MIVGLVGFLLVLVFCGFFAGMETGLYSLERVRLQVRAEAGDRRARWLAPVLEHPARAVCSLLLATNVAHYLLAHFAAGLIERFMHSPDVYSQKALDTAFLTPVLFVLGDLVPKNVFLKQPGRLMIFTQPLLRVTMAVFRPLVAPLVWVAERTQSGDHRKVDAASFFDRGSIDFMLTIDDEAAQLTPPQRELAERVLRLRSVHVRDRMVPLELVSAVDLGAHVAQVVETGARRRHSRVLVRSPDHSGFIGYVNVVDAAAAAPGTVVESLLHTLPTLDAELPITTALFRLQRTGRPLAAVSSGPGRAVVGLIAAYDMVEVLFAETARSREAAPRSAETPRK